VSIHSFRARAARAGLHRPVGWLRNLGLHPNDVFIASHGRSGDTMLRFILGEILSGIPTNFDNIQQIVPEIGVQSKALAILPGNGRLIKSHEPYRRKYKRAIYLIRDVRDTVLSYYARETAVGSIHPDCEKFDDYLAAFMQGKVNHFGRWQAHVEGWMNSPLVHRGDLLLVRFEDMRQDTLQTINRCLEFLGRPTEPSIVQAAIANNTLENMRVKEDRSAKFPKSPLETGRQVGKGAIEGWRDKLTETQLHIIEECASNVLARFGYASSLVGPPPKSEPPLPAQQQQTVISFARGGSNQWHAPKASPPAVIADSSGTLMRVRMGGWIANFFSWYRY
jgi:Sulfotransferase domain